MWRGERLFQLRKAFHKLGRGQRHAAKAVFIMVTIIGWLFENEQVSRIWKNNGVWKIFAEDLYMSKVGAKNSAKIAEYDDQKEDCILVFQGHHGVSSN